MDVTQKGVLRSVLFLHLFHSCRQDNADTTTFKPTVNWAHSPFADETLSDFFFCMHTDID